MSSSERIDDGTVAIEEALSRIGERISESEAAGEICKCKEGMFALAATRRQLFGGGCFFRGGKETSRSNGCAAWR
jgi:hypothetical protein